MAEFVRVLRPGGHLVISDSRGLVGDIGLPLVKAGPNGEPGYMPHKNRLTSDYLKAAIPLGLQVRRCEEPRRPYPLVNANGEGPGAAAPVPVHVPGAAPPNLWALHGWASEATNAAYRDSPVAIVMHFQLADA